MLFLWCSLAAVLGLARHTLNVNQMRLHVLSMLGFPILGTAWKAYQQATDFPHQGIPNRLQHLIWAATMVGLLLPVLAVVWRKFSTPTVLLQTLVCISAIGLIGEIGEFLLQMSLTRASVAYYFLAQDTLLDVAMNAIGGSVAAALCSYFRKDSDPVPALQFALPPLSSPLI